MPGDDRAPLDQRAPVREPAMHVSRVHDRRDPRAGRGLRRKTRAKMPGSMHVMGTHRW